MLDILTQAKEEVENLCYIWRAEGEQVEKIMSAVVEKTSPDDSTIQLSHSSESSIQAMWEATQESLAQLSEDQVDIARRVVRVLKDFIRSELEENEPEDTPVIDSTSSNESRKRQRTESPAVEETEVIAAFEEATEAETLQEIETGNVERQNASEGLGGIRNVVLVENASGRRRSTKALAIYLQPTMFPTHGRDIDELELGQRGSQVIRIAAQANTAALNVGANDGTCHPCCMILIFDSSCLLRARARRVKGCLFSSGWGSQCDHCALKARLCELPILNTHGDLKALALSDLRVVGE
jgi:hypothetical protein